MHTRGNTRRSTRPAERSFHLGNRRLSPLPPAQTETRYPVHLSRSHISAGRYDKWNSPEEKKSQLLDEIRDRHNVGCQIPNRIIFFTFDLSPN